MNDMPVLRIARHSADDCSGEHAAMKITQIDPKTLEIPAVFVNHFQMAVIGDAVVRVTFGEQPSPQSRPAHRAALLLSIGDLRQFCQQILNALSVPQGSS